MRLLLGLWPSRTRFDARSGFLKRTASHAPLGGRVVLCLVGLAMRRTYLSSRRTARALPSACCCWVGLGWTGPNARVLTTKHKHKHTQRRASMNPDQLSLSCSAGHNPPVPAAAVEQEKQQQLQSGSDEDSSPCRATAPCPSCPRRPRLRCPTRAPCSGGSPRVRFHWLWRLCCGIGIIYASARRLPIWPNDNCTYIHTCSAARRLLAARHAGGRGGERGADMRGRL